MEGLAILIPAAGFGRRMRGVDKLLEPVDGVPLLARQVGRACATGAMVLVTLPVAGAFGREAALRDSDARLIPVADAAEGMAASVRAGARAAMAARVRGLMVLPADMPDLETADLVALGATWHASGGSAIVQATTADGRPGHPVILPADLLPEVAEVTGDTGARAVVQAHAERIRRHPLPDQRALIDLDTPEAWAKWRAGRPDSVPKG